MKSIIQEIADWQLPGREEHEGTVKQAGVDIGKMKGKHRKEVIMDIWRIFSDLKLPVRLLQLCHGAVNVCLQHHAALVCLPLRLPEQNHLLLKMSGVPLLCLTPTMSTAEVIYWAPVSVHS